MFEIVSFLALLAVGYGFGSYREKAHYASLREREAKFGRLRIRTDRKNIEAAEARFVAASVVIASDYFKDVLGAVMNFFGGRVRVLETLMDRSRREAIVRLQEEAQTWGGREIVGFRLEFATLDRAGVEVLAYGTAVK